MARAQLEYANWHVTARGARRLLLFHDDADYKVFYGMLGESCRHTEVNLIADCLMSNHFHLSLGAGTRQLASCMQRLNRAYSGYHNNRYGLSGHAFEQRYYGEPIASDFILTRVVRYIHLNPIRSRRVGRPEDYPWSSYRRLISTSEESLSDAEWGFLQLFSHNSGTAQKAYRAFTESDMDRITTPAIGRTPAWEIWQEQFRWILEYVRNQGEFLAPLETDVVAVYLGSKAGIPPRAMGKVLDHPDGRIVSRMKRLIRDRLEDCPSLQTRIDSLGVL